MPKFPSGITQPWVLVVEGEEDKFFFEAFTEYLGLGQIQIVPLGGKTELRRNLSTLIITSGHENILSLAVVRDADLNAASAFQSVCDALKAVGLPAPTRPLVSTGQNPQVTVMILPQEGVNGMLEDLCLRSVAEDSAAPCVDQYFECLQERNVPSAQNMSKARVQVFLASKEKTLRLGEAAKAGYWPFSDVAFAQVKSFLQQICLQTNIQ